MSAVPENLLTRIEHPIVAAPMAGGASTPALAAAVSQAGGLGFLAAGYKDAAAVREEVAAVRELTRAPFGVNLFVPTVSDADDAAITRYRRELGPEAQRYRVELGTAPQRDDDGWEQKLALIAAERVAVVGFTFGCPDEQTVARLHAAGSQVIVTVTSVHEAQAAARVDADTLCVQGPEAGGHRGSFAALSAPDAAVGLLPLLARIRAAVDVPLVAAGGITDGAGIAAVLAAGAVAAQLGTAFLRTPQCGAHPLHKAALIDPRFPGTTVTRAFTGRPARALANRFIAEHDGHAPAAYPQIHHLTRALRQAAAAAGDPGGMALWAGQGHRAATDHPADHLVALLAAQAFDAHTAAGRRLHRAAG